MSDKREGPHPVEICGCEKCRSVIAAQGGYDDILLVFKGNNHTFRGRILKSSDGKVIIYADPDEIAPWIKK